jgi:anaerobic selenocysteine-containing dehydrogenase
MSLLADERRWMPSACILCECNCGVEVQVEDRHLAKIRGDKSHPASEGYACEKAQRLDRYQSNPNRLTSPLRRRPDGSYEKIGWEQAISEIAERLTAIRDEHGGERIFFYGGGGQGNHLGRVYGAALQAAVGSKYYSNALAQEKCGEMWVDGKLYGGHTKGDFERADVVMFVGKNPWQSHSFPRARPVLKELAADPDRTMIVIDPRRSETAAMADIHLQVKPGTDAWCLAALGAVIVQEDLVDREFIEQHTTGAEPVLEALGAVPVGEYAERCGVPEHLIRETARRFAAADAACTYEDLGIQQSPNSTLSSYLNKLLWILTGNFAKPGAMFLHSTFAPVAGSGASDRTRHEPGLAERVVRRAAAEAVGIAGPAVSQLAGMLPDFVANEVATRFQPLVTAQSGAAMSSAVGSAGARTTPVTGARIIAGLVPCNSIADEILTDHPDRFRAIWLDSVNPAHSLAQSERFREAMRALELSVVVDVAMTETARLADYVLPAASQFEKPECTFFNVDFPRNSFQLRRPLVSPLPGTLPEPEIYARLIRQLGIINPGVLKRLAAAARRGRSQFAVAFFTTIAADPSLMRLAPYLLYETLGPTLPDGTAGAAGLWVVAQLCALSNPHAVARAGFTGPGFEPGEQLFERILEGRGVTFTVDDYPDTWNYVRRPDRRFTIEIPELLAQLHDLHRQPSSWTTAEFPFILMAGERRSYTANTIIRDPEWRKRDRDGALRIAVEDADRLGVSTGERVRIVTESGAAEATVEVTDIMQPGHVSLPNGLGLDFTDAAGAHHKAGVAPNDLTSLHHKDQFAGTPWHKHVPARLEPIT